MGAGENSGHNGLIYDLDSGDGFKAGLRYLQTH